MMKLWSVVLVAMLAVVHVDAEARRMGGGKSVGRQSSNVTQRESAAPSAAPGAPAQNATNAAAARPVSWFMGGLQGAWVGLNVQRAVCRDDRPAGFVFS